MPEAASPGRKVTLAGTDVVRPTQILAQVPAGVTCSTLVKGCRALSFTYATTTTASRQPPSATTSAESLRSPSPPGTPT